jgi:hypothetical protein
VTNPIWRLSTDGLKLEAAKRECYALHRRMEGLCCQREHTNAKPSWTCKCSCHDPSKELELVKADQIRTAGDSSLSVSSLALAIYMKHGLCRYVPGEDEPYPNAVSAVEEAVNTGRSFES